MPQYCTVFHRIDSIKIDGEDADRNPDRVPVTGTIVFTPILAQGDSVVVTEDGVKSTLNIEPATAQIQLGQLMHRGELGVKLFAGGENSNPERIRWRATFHNLISGTTKITLKDVMFEAIPGGELALSLTQPVPSKPYPGFSQSFEEALQAITEAGENAAIELEANVTEAVSNATNAASGYAQEAKDYRDAADTARQAAVQAQGLAETAADEANQKAQAIFDNYHATRARIIWAWEGTGNPLLSDFPHAKPKDFIQRKDPVTGNTTGEWRIDE